jgi:lipopolysaccharide assembly outer membrane protein LptD (OstA)
MKKFLVLVLLSVVCSAFANDFRDLKIQRKDSVQGFKFSVPVGEKKWAVIEGKTAFDITSSEITAKDVIVRYYNDGILVSTLKADSIVYNRIDKQLQAEGNVKVKTISDVFKDMNSQE